MKITKPYGDSKNAKVLVIGHDPRLQKSHTQADYVFFADYFFRKIPKRSSERAKYNLAESLFSYLGYITSYKYSASQYFITNLCNESLNHAPKNKTVLIPENIAEKSISEFRNILSVGKYELIFPMSQQVNYLLQKYSFYFSNDDYISASEPKEIGLKNGYYEPKGNSPFLKICGNKYFVGDVPLIPILHVKQYPLKGGVKKNYGPKYESIINIIKEL